MSKHITWTYKLHLMYEQGVDIPPLADALDVYWDAQSRRVGLEMIIDAEAQPVRHRVVMLEAHGADAGPVAGMLPVGTVTHPENGRLSVFIDLPLQNIAPDAAAPWLTGPGA